MAQPLPPRAPVGLGLTPRPLTTTDGAITLDVFRSSDVGVLAACFADPATARWNPGPSDGNVPAWIALRNDWSDGSHVSWAVRGGGGRLLGSLSIFKIDAAQSSAQVGYFVLPPERGHGVARRALALGVAFAFGERAIHRIELFHAIENRASCSVATAAGFGLEGVLRESYVYADGLRHDEHLHARLATDRVDVTAPGLPCSTGD